MATRANSRTAGRWPAGLLALLVLLGALAPGMASVTDEVAAGDAGAADSQCGPFAAWDDLMSSSSAGSHAELVWLIRCLPEAARESLKEQAAGRAILAPANLAVNQRIWRIGFTRPAAGGCPVFSDEGLARLMEYLGRMFVPARRFARELPGLEPCDLLASVFELQDGEESRWSKIMQRRLGNLDKVARRSPRDGGTGRRLQQIGDDYNGHYVGYGYDVLSGFPASTTSGLDPGIGSKMGPFVLTGSSYTAKPATSCVSTMATTSSNSHAELQKNLAVRAGVSGQSAKVSFSANGDFNQMTATQTQENGFSFIQGTQVALEQYLLNSPQYMDLNPDFVNATLAIAYWSDLGDVAQLSNAMLYVYQVYGTHFITATRTGAQQNLILQMSNSNSESLSQQKINLNLAASGTFGVVKGSLTVGVDQGESSINQIITTSSTQKFMLAPSTLEPPYLNATGNTANPYPAIDCVQWTKDLLDSGDYTISQFKIAELVGLMAIPSLWQRYNVAPATLRNVAKLYRAYIQSCSATDSPNGLPSCTLVADTCAPGSFNEQGNARACRSCYSSGSLCSTSLDCSPTTGECLPGSGATSGLLGGTYFAVDKSILSPTQNNRNSFTFDPVKVAASGAKWNDTTYLPQNALALPSDALCTCKPARIPCAVYDLARCSVVAGVSYADPSSASLIGTYDSTSSNIGIPQDCCDLCSENSDCSYWVFDVSGDPKYCYLHQAGVPGDSFSVKSQSYVGTSRAKDDPLLLPNITYGSDTFLSSRPLNSSFEFPAQTCALACRDAPASSCGAWSFSESRRRCFFKSGGQAYSSSSGSWSGPRKPNCTTGCEGDLGCGSNTAYVFSGYYVPAVQHDVRLKLQATESAAVWFGLNKGFSAANAIVTFTSTLPNGQLNTGSSQSQAFTLKAGVAYAVRVYWYVKQDGAFFSLVNTLTGDEFLSPKRSLARLVFYSSTADGF